MANRRSAYTFRLTAEGLQELERDFTKFFATVESGAEAFQKFKNLSPQLRDAFAAADQAMARTRKSLADTAAGGAVLDELTGKLQGLTGEAGAVGSVLARLGPAGAAAAAGLGGMVAVASQANAAIGAKEKGLRQLTGVLQATGYQAGVTSQEIAALAKELEDSTGATEENVLAAARVLSTFRGVGAESFGQTIRLAQDMAEVFGGDVRSNTELLGRALAKLAGGEVEGLGRSFGFLGSTTLTAIEQLAKTGQTAEAQRVFLERLRDTVGGQGGLGRGGLSGEIKGLGDDWGDLLQRLGRTDGVVKQAIASLRGFVQELDRNLSPDGRVADIDRRLGQLSVLGRRWNTPGADRLRGERAEILAGQSDQAMAATAEAVRADEGRRAAAAEDALAKDAERRRILSEITRELDRQLQLSGQSAEARERGLAADQAEAKLRQQMANPRAEDVAAVRAAAEAAVARSQATEKQLKLQKDLAKAAADDAAQQDRDREAARKRGAEIIAADKKREQSLDGYIRGLEQAATLDAQSATDKKVQAALIEAQNKLLDEQGNKLRSLSDAEKARIESAVRQAEAYEKQREAAEKAARELERQIEKGTDRGVEKAADLLYDTFEGEITDVGELLRKTLHRAAAEAMAEMVLRPLIQPVVSWGVQAMQGLGFGGGGGGGGVGGQVAGTANGGGGFGIGNLSSFSNLMPSSWTGGLSSSINAFGASYLGLNGAGAAQAAASTYGISAGQAAALSNSGALGSTASLSGILGAAGLGFAGGSLLASLTGGNPTGGGIGGGLGAGAGFLIGGPIGAVIGGAAGGLLGGMFGGKKKRAPVPSGTTSILASDNRFSVGATVAENADPNVTLSVATQVVAALNQVVERFGLLATGGTTIGQGASTGPNNINDSFGVLVATGGLSSPDADIQKILRKSIGESFETAVRNLEFGELFKNIAELQRPANQLRDSFEALGKQFDEVVQKSESFDLSIARLREGAAANENQNLDLAIQQIVNPLQYALDRQAETEQARLEYIEKIGGDIAKAERLNMLERARIIEQAGAGLNSWLQGQLLGNTSTLTGTARLSEAQSQFGAAVTAAREGRGGTAAVTQLGEVILSLGQQLYGGTAQAAALESMVRSTISSLGRDLGLPGFATGGSFTVGAPNMGFGGVDATLVRFRANQGETVTVTPAGMSGGASSADIGELAIQLGQLNANLETLVRLTGQQGEGLRGLRNLVELQMNQLLAQRHSPKAA